jgi:hypothetical protein
MLFTSLTNIEHIKACYVDMDIFHTKTILAIFWKFFLVDLQLPEQVQKYTQDNKTPFLQIQMKRREIIFQNYTLHLI